MARTGEPRARRNAFGVSGVDQTEWSARSWLHDRRVLSRR
jgi:hypothetical protein